MSLSALLLKRDELPSPKSSLPNLPKALLLAAALSKSTQKKCPLPAALDASLSWKYPPIQTASKLFFYSSANLSLHLSSDPLFVQNRNRSYLTVLRSTFLIGVELLLVPQKHYLISSLQVLHVDSFPDDQSSSSTWLSEIWTLGKISCKRCEKISAPKWGSTNMPLFGRVHECKENEHWSEKQVWIVSVMKWTLPKNQGDPHRDTSETQSHSGQQMNIKALILKENDVSKRL